MSVETLLALMAAAMLAGWVDAISGGGGLIQLPALLVALPDEEPATLFGTNKSASIVGTTAAMITYLRRTQARPDLRTAAPMAVMAFLGSMSGALLVSQLPTDVIRPTVLVLLIGVAIWVARQRDLGMQENLRWSDRRRHVGVAVAAGGLIGFYDGILGPGTGSFLVVALVGLLGYSFLRATATAKVVNVGTNAAALLVFVPAGHLLPVVAGAMASANLVGGLMGARMAIARGNRFVRIVYLLVVTVLIIRLGWDVLTA